MDSPLSFIQPVILCGGSGTRLWPASRTDYPKPFLSLTDGSTLLQRSLDRLKQISPYQSPIFVCGEAHRFLVLSTLQQRGIKPAAIILEQEERNTATAVALAAEKAAPGTLLLILPADHHWENPAALPVQEAATFAMQGTIVIFGIQPTGPETGFGYIRKGHDIGATASNVVGFFEKPARADAERYIAEGMLWNAGILLARRETLIAELQSHVPYIQKAAETSMARAVVDQDFVRPCEENLRDSVSLSFDNAVLEKTKKACVIPCNIGWSDLGSWENIWGICDKDASGNAKTGNGVFYDSDNCYAHSEGPLIVTAGLKDVAVIATSDAVLVTRLTQSQSIKNLIPKLENTCPGVTRSGPRSVRPWGSYEVLFRGDGFLIKRLTVLSGKKLSLQKHQHRAEHWIVLSGTALVTKGEETLQLEAQQSVFLPPQTLHRLMNENATPLIVIEVQSGTVLREDDIIRYEDAYGRTCQENPRAIGPEAVA
jgi:mannose-1-phosphate guanylyltransferase/mannose-6-phosphate isomerase